jgi:hypothetical protein
VYSPLGDRGLFDGDGYGNLLAATDAADGITFIQSLLLDPDAEALEVFKYQNAVNFRAASAKDGLALDLAYDGIILQRSMEANAIILNYTQADFVIMDYEGFGARETWIETVHLSANAELKRQPGESNVSLAIRLGRQFLQNHTRSLLQYAPADVKLGVYDLMSTGEQKSSVDFMKRLIYANAIAQFWLFYFPAQIAHLTPSGDRGMQQFSWSDYASVYLYSSQPSEYTNQQTIPFLSARYRQEQQALPPAAVSTPWFAMEQWAGTMPGDVWFAAFAHLYVAEGCAGEAASNNG